MSHNAKNKVAQDLGSSSYREQVQEEGRFWGKASEEALKHGIPPWVDIRRAHDFTRDVSGVWDDVRLHQLLFGEQLRFVLSEAGKAYGAKVLDLGCGAGWLSLELARNGLHVEGLDVSEGQIAIARRFAESNPYLDRFGSLTYRVADLSTVTLDAETYDVVTAWGALHHIYDLNHLFHEVHKALKPGGVFLIFDDIDWHWKNHVWMALAYLMIPSHEALTHRLFKLVRRLLYGEPIILTEEERKRSPQDTGADSPFEMVHGPDIVDLVHRYFHVDKMETSVAFTQALFFYITRSADSWAYRHRYEILAKARDVESILIKCRLAQGTMVLMRAHPQKRSLPR